MQKQILMLAAEMLDLASDVFSARMSNELSKEIQELITDEILFDFRDWTGEDDQVDEIGDDHLMEYLRDKLREQAAEHQ